MFWASSSTGNVSDIRVADELIEVAGPVRRLIADRGYDANSLRLTLRSVGTIPVIPGRRSHKRPIRHDERRYRDRWRIEAAFCHLKDFRRVAMPQKMQRSQVFVGEFALKHAPRCVERTMLAEIVFPPDSQRRVHVVHELDEDQRRRCNAWYRDATGYAFEDDEAFCRRT